MRPKDPHSAGAALPLAPFPPKRPAPPALPQFGNGVQLTTGNCFNVSVHPDRIAALLVPFLADQRLSPAQLDQLARYLDLLVRWNQRLNLTAVRNPESIVTRHFGESLFLARHALLPPARRGELTSGFQINDLGSGAGFPGIPLKLWAPAVSVTLIESHHKKATFLREVVRALGLVGLTVFAGRAEDFPARAALVTLRAVEHFERALPLAARMVAPAGRLALLIGAAQLPAAQRLAPTLAWSTALPVPLSDARVLLLGTNPERHEPTS